MLRHRRPRDWMDAVTKSTGEHIVFPEISNALYMWTTWCGYYQPFVIICFSFSMHDPLPPGWFTVMIVVGIINSNDAALQCNTQMSIATFVSLLRSSTAALLTGTTAMNSCWNVPRRPPYNFNSDKYICIWRGKTHTTHSCNFWSPTDS